MTGLPSRRFRIFLGDIESFFDAEFDVGFKYVDSSFAGLPLVSGIAPFWLLRLGISKYIPVRQPL